MSPGALRPHVSGNVSVSSALRHCPTPPPLLDPPLLPPCAALGRPSIPLATNLTSLLFPCSDPSPQHPSFFGHSRQRHAGPAKRWVQPPGSTGHVVYFFPRKDGRERDRWGRERARLLPLDNGHQCEKEDVGAEEVEVKVRGRVCPLTDGRANMKRERQQRRKRAREVWRRGERDAEGVTCARLMELKV